MLKPQSEIVNEIIRLGKEREKVTTRQKTINLHFTETYFIRDLAKELNIPHLTLMRGMVRYGIGRMNRSDLSMYLDITSYLAKIPMDANKEISDGYNFSNKYAKSLTFSYKDIEEIEYHASKRNLTYSSMCRGIIKYETRTLARELDIPHRYVFGYTIRPYNPEENKFFDYDYQNVDPNFSIKEWRKSNGLD